MARENRSPRDNGEKASGSNGNVFVGDGIGTDEHADLLGRSHSGRPGDSSGEPPDDGDGSSDGTLAGDPLESTYRAALGNADHWGLPGDPSAKRYPRLWALLSRLKLPNGKSREPSPITLKLTPQGASATLTDYTISHSLTVAFEHVQDVLKAFELALASPRPSWKPVKRGTLYNKKRSEDAKIPGEF